MKWILWIVANVFLITGRVYLERYDFSTAAFWLFLAVILGVGWIVRMELELYEKRKNKKDPSSPIINAKQANDHYSGKETWKASFKRQAEAANVDFVLNAINENPKYGFLYFSATALDIYQREKLKYLGFNVTLDQSDSVRVGWEIQRSIWSKLFSN